MKPNHHFTRENSSGREKSTEKSLASFNATVPSAPGNTNNSHKRSKTSCKLYLSDLCLVIGTSNFHIDYPQKPNNYQFDIFDIDQDDATGLDSGKIQVLDTKRK